MHKRKQFKRFLSAVVIVGLSSAVSARADFDVSPGAAGGHITTNAFEDATETFVNNVRVFHYAFDDPDNPFFTQDPGFHPLSGSGLPTGTTITASVNSPLTYWNGTGPVSFAGLPNGETLKLQKGTPSLTVGSTIPAGTLTIATTDASGEFDEHLESTLIGGGAANPTDGIYLTSLILNGSTPGAGDSEPMFLVYNNGLDDQAEIAAVTAVRDAFAPGSNLAGVPEPGSVALLGAVGLCLLARRRRASHGPAIAKDRLQ
jgi:hypothetical protein